MVCSLKITYFSFDYLRCPRLIKCLAFVLNQTYISHQKRQKARDLHQIPTIIAFWTSKSTSKRNNKY